VIPDNVAVATAAERHNPGEQLVRRERIERDPLIRKRRPGAIGLPARITGGDVLPPFSGRQPRVHRLRHRECDLVVQLVFQPQPAAWDPRCRRDPLATGRGPWHGSRAGGVLGGVPAKHRQWLSRVRSSASPDAAAIKSAA
jgi:hypothetical protein